MDKEKNLSIFISIENFKEITDIVLGSFGCSKFNHIGGRGFCTGEIEHLGFSSTSACRTECHEYGSKNGEGCCSIYGDGNGECSYFKGGQEVKGSCGTIKCETMECMIGRNQ